MSSERAPQLLFDDGSRAIQQTAVDASSSSSATATVIEAKSARGTSIAISNYYEIDRLASEIIAIVQQKRAAAAITTKEKDRKDAWFARVALQFPDELLCDAPEVCWEMEDALLHKVVQVLDKEQQPQQSAAQQPQQQQQPQQSLVFCLGDTTFGPCCPDEVAALHLTADVLVHYGHACLSHPALQLPVLYGFGVTEHWNTECCVEAILQQAKAEGVRRLLLLYQVRYFHAMEELQTQLSERGDIFLVTGQVPQEPLESFLLASSQQQQQQGEAKAKSGACCGGNSDCATNNRNDTTEQPNKDDTQQQTTTTTLLDQPFAPRSKHFLLGGLEVPQELDFSTFSVVFVGDQATTDGTTTAREGQRQYMNTILWYLSAKSRPLSLWTYSPMTQSLVTSTPAGIQRQLNRRFYLIQKARDASIFGILIGTLSQRYFRSVVQTLRKVIEQQHGRTSYTFAMGKVNPAKIANFAEIECFIMVACAETSWLDEGEQREMHVPIITPLELHMALGSGGPEVQWGECDYSLDYNDFLMKYPNALTEDDDENIDDSAANNTTDGSDDDDDDDDEDAPYFSLITGKYESKSKGSAGEGVDLKALPGKGQLTTYKSEAAEFLKNREYKGLEPNVGETEVRAAVPGQQGIASKYNNDLGNK